MALQVHDVTVREGGKLPLLLAARPATLRATGTTAT